jgi:uroporphyrinogen-III synthase
LSERLAGLGAEVIELPTIEVVGPSDGGAALQAAAARVAEYDWVAFSSANAVERFCASLRDARAFGAARVAAMGPATADALRRFGVAADLVPDRFVAEALVEVFPAGPGRVLLPQAAAARDVLADGLRARGWEVDVVEAYRTERVQPDDATVAAARTADAVTFTSSSTVRNYVDAVGTDAVPPVVACIGPVTAGTAEELGLRVDVVAETSTVDGLVDALVAALSG